MKTIPAHSPDLREIWSLLRRKIRLIGLTMSLVFGAALIYLFYVTPLYSATAWLFVDTAQKNLLSAEERLTSPGSGDNARIESEVLILKSNTVALATIEKAQLISHPLYKPRITLADKAKLVMGLEPAASQSATELISGILRKVDDATRIRRMGQTYLISVSASSQDPEHAAELANTLSQTYIDLQVESKVNATLAARDILQDQIASAQGLLAQTEGAFDRYIETNIDQLAHESGDLKLQVLREQLLETSAFHLAAEAAMDLATKSAGQRDWVTLANTLGDEALKNLTNDRAKLEQKLGKFDPSTPEEIELRRQLAKIDEDIQSKTSSALSELKLDETQLALILRDQRATLRKTVLQGDLSSTTLAQLYQFQQEADIAQRHYSTLLSRASDLQAQALVHIADTRIVSAALPPSNARFPNKQLILVLTTILALVLGVGLAFLSEYYVGGITSTIQLANVLAAPVAASVPRVAMLPDQNSVADYVIDSPLSLYAESLRLVRSAIDQSLRSNTPRKCTVIMVTSSIPAEGKSTISLALARTFAVAGKSTLLIDADLRKPTLQTYLDVIPETSLLEHLSGVHTSDGSFYTSDPRSDLGVVMGRERANVPTDQLLQSEGFLNLLDTAKASMDIVILDTSPLLPVVDARYIARHADVVIDCVRFGVTEQRDIRTAFNSLANSVREGTPILTLLNHDESKTAGYRYEGYYGDD